MHQALDLKRHSESAVGVDCRLAFLALVTALVGIAAERDGDGHGIGDARWIDRTDCTKPGKEVGLVALVLRDRQRKARRAAAASSIV